MSDVEAGEERGTPPDHQDLREYLSDDPTGIKRMALNHHLSLLAAEILPGIERSYATSLVQQRIEENRKLPGYSEALAFFARLDKTMRALWREQPGVEPRLGEEGEKRDIIAGFELVEKSMKAEGLISE